MSVCTTTVHEVVCDSCDGVISKAYSRKAALDIARPFEVSTLSHICCRCQLRRSIELPREFPL